MHILRQLVLTSFFCSSTFLSLAQDALSPTYTVEVLIHISDSLKKEKEYEAAMKYLNQAVKASYNSSSWELYLESLNRKARLFASQRKNKERFSTLLLSKATIGQHLPCFSLQKANILKHLGEIYLSRNQADSCQSYLQQASSIFSYLEERKSYSWCKTLMAVSCYRENSYEQMEIHLDSAYQCAQQYLDKTESIFPTIYQLQTGLYYASGEYSKALEVGLSVLALRKLPSSPSLFRKYHADDFNNVATTYNFLGDQEHAIEYHLQALKVRKQLGRQKDITQSYINLGLAYKMNREYDLAKSYLRKALSNPKNADKIPSRLHIKALQNISSLYRDLNDPDSAMEYLNLAFKLHEKDTIDLERSHRILGLNYKTQGKNQRALHSLEKSIEIALKTRRKRHPFIAHSYEYTAQVYMEVEQWEQALAHFDKALLAANTHKVNISAFGLEDSILPPDVILATRLFKQKGDCLQKMAVESEHGKIQLWKESLVSFEKAMYLIDKMRHSDRQELAQQELSERYLDIYEWAIEKANNLYHANGDPTYLHQAFTYAEKAKAYTLLKNLRENDAIHFAHIPDSLQLKEKAYQHNIFLYKRKIYEEEQKQNINELRISRWQDLVFANKRAFEALIRQLEHQYPRYYQLKYKQEIATVEDLGKYLRDDQACISYFWGKDQVFVFAFNRNTLDLHRITDADSLAKNLRSFVQDISQQEKIRASTYDANLLSSWKQKSHRIFQQILAPVLPDQIQSLVILPDGPLSYMPFEILLTPTKSAGKSSLRNLPYLIKDYIIHYEYSATVLLRKDDLLSTGLKKFVGFAPVYQAANDPLSGNKIRTETSFLSAPKLSALQHNQDEVRLIAEIMGGSSFLGTEAMKKNLLEQAPAYQVVHLASHGFANNENPAYSGLFFTHSAPDWKSGFLSATEIYEMELNTWLTTLSACNTGSGKYLKGEGIFSLARAFKYAGSQNILMSQWQVDDASTHEIMVRFYKELKADVPLATALRKAKLDYLENSPRPHPYFWASFALIGENESIPKTWGSSGMLRVMLLLLIVLISFYFFRKRKIA